MEAAVVSVGKAALDGLLSGAKSTIAEESALAQAIQRDMVFLADELEEMRSTLRGVDEEQDYHKVPRRRVKQLRSLAYDVEDCLQEYSVHLEKPSGWRRARAVLERHRIAADMKGLRARVEDMNQRNLHHQLMHNGGSKPANTTEQSGQSNISAARIFGIHEKGKSKVDLVHLIQQDGEDLRVIAVWGTSGDLGLASIINEAYENPDIEKKFPCRAWVRVMHPFNKNDFIQSLVNQFQSTERIGVLLEAEKTREELAEEFTRYVNQKGYLIVLNDMPTFEVWIGIRTYFPNNKKGSRIIVCTPQAEVASLCAGQESQVSKLKQLSTDQTIYAFYEKGCQDTTNLPMPILPSSNAATTSTINSVENQSKCGNENKMVTKSLTRIKTMPDVLEESQLIGRKKETSDMVKLISGELGQQFSVISVWGMGGVGKTTLVKDVYQNQNLIGIFEKRAFVTVMRPFNLKELLGRLIVQLSAKPSEKGATRNTLALLGAEALREKLAKLLRNKCLIVLDDLSSTTEWDMIICSFPKMEKTSRIIVTTREENIAKHCSEKQENIYTLKMLEYNDAFDLFTRKVFGEITNWDEQYPELADEARSILKKCNGLPLAIVTIGGLLKFRPRTATEWRKLHESISAESDINPEFGNMMTVLGKSYDDLPYHIKLCFLYSSIFPEGHKIRRRRLVKRWTAEGYSREIHGWLPQSAEEVADKYFMELIDRSMILPSQESIHSLKGIDSCQVHDIMRDISISKSEGENFVFRLEEDYRSNNQGTVRHLVISGNWNGNKSHFENAVNLSRIRSLTVFGKWRHFFISDKMRLLRVLDLEETTGLVDHHLKHIGKFLHLKFLSLRGCHGIYHLPDSVGNLVHIQTLDVKNTSIIKLPKAIIRLRKLEYLRAGRHRLVGSRFLNYSGQAERRLGILTLRSVGFCVACWAPQLMKQFGWMDGDLNRSDVCTVYCCNVLPGVARGLDPCVVVMPSGANKLTALHTLGTVNIGRGTSIIQGIGSLTQLKKLGVSGVNKKNSQEFCSALANLVKLESLLVQSRGVPGLRGCLDHLLSPPHNLQSLKLYGTLVRLPEWIAGLQNLVKLVLRMTELTEVDGTMQVLGKLPNLGILRLLWLSFDVGEQLHVSFRREEFLSLMVLHLDEIGNLGSVEFEEAGATPRLEQLVLEYSVNKTRSISGLSSLRSLKEVVIKGGCSEELVGDVREQLSRNENNPVFKME